MEPVGVLRWVRWAHINTFGRVSGVRVRNKLVCRIGRGMISRLESLSQLKFVVHNVWDAPWIGRHNHSESADNISSGNCIDVIGFPCVYSNGDIVGLVPSV